MSADALAGIDHAVVLVRDLEGARTSFARLGFTATPRGTHSAHMGTGNHCLMFESDYIELLGILKPTDLNAGWRRQLELREGVAALALATSDAGRSYEALTERGLEPSDPIAFSRPVDLPEGKAEAAFRIVRLPEAAVPGAGLFVCGHLTRGAVWRPEWQAHANGAVGIALVTVAVPDPDAAAGLYRRVFGREHVAESRNRIRIDTGGAPIRLVAGEGPAHVSGLSLVVADLGRAEAALAAGSVPRERGASVLRVAPEAACGVALEFLAK
ncbi:MAG: VOC family protein [Alphaproteobacteria bacterium]|nr:VOC family protein [Alphaproteobacteria bacterium]